MPDNYWNGRSRGRKRFPAGIEITYVVPELQLDPVAEIKRMIRDRMRTPNLQTGQVWNLTDAVVPVIQIPIGDL